MQFFATSDALKIAYVIDDYTDPWHKAPTLVMLHSAMSSSRRLYALVDRKSTRLNSSHVSESRMPSSA